MSEPYIGEIRMFGGNFPPRGFATCAGQLLAINQNQSLFSLLGTTYGGDGRTTFGLPDMRGRIPIHMGAGPGLTPRQMGSKGGTENETLLPAHLPRHTHASSGMASSAEAGARNPRNLAPAVASEPTYVGEAEGDTSMASDGIGSAGGGQAHTNMQPYHCVTFIIALQGLFPSRN